MDENVWGAYLGNRRGPRTQPLVTCSYHWREKG